MRQAEITAYFRALVVEVFVKWQYFFDLRPETLFLAIYLFDGYMAARRINRRTASLLFVTCIFTASKFEEVKIVRLGNFLAHCEDREVTPEAVFDMEKELLERLGYNLSYVCPYDFLKRVFFIYKTDLDKCKLTRHPRLLFHRVLPLQQRLQLLQGVGEGHRRLLCHGGHAEAQDRQGEISAVHIR